MKILTNPRQKFWMADAIMFRTRLSSWKQSSPSAPRTSLTRLKSYPCAGRPPTLRLAPRCPAVKKRRRSQLTMPPPTKIRLKLIMRRAALLLRTCSSCKGQRTRFATEAFAFLPRATLKARMLMGQRRPPFPTGTSAVLKMLAMRMLLIPHQQVFRTILRLPTLIW